MNLNGLLVGLATFLIIGLFHPLVIKAEYYLGVRCWWISAGEWTRDGSLQARATRNDTDTNNY